MNLPSIVRFLIGSFLLMTGCLLVLSGAITVIGLPIGLIVLGAGMSLMLTPRDQRSS